MYIAVFIYLLTFSSNFVCGYNSKIAENNELLVHSFEQFSQWGMNYLGIDNTISQNSPRTEKSLVSPSASITKTVHSIQKFSGLSLNKRDEDSSRAPECSFIGILGYNDTFINTCNGEFCMVTQVNCSGVLYNNGTDSGAPSNMASNPDCFVTKMMCYADIISENDMKEQHNAEECSIEHIYCDGKERNASSISNRSLFSRCIIQLSCHSNYRRYGYNYYGYYCKQQSQLYCTNGTYLDVDNLNLNDTNTLNSLVNCSVVSRSCTSNEMDSSSSNCYQVNKTCVGDIVEGCMYNKYFTSCASNSKEPTCYISALLCNGTIVTSILDSYKGCTIHELTCSNNTILNVDIDLDSSNCTSNSFICTGFQFNSIDNFRGNIFNCYAQNLICIPQNETTRCDYYQMSCDGDSLCDVSVSKFLCNDPSRCYDYVNISSCICPIDRNGSDCSSYRPLSCNLKLMSPKEQCNKQYYSSDSKSSLLDGDPACLLFGLQDTASLQYNLSCAFQNPGAYIDPRVEEANFTYFIQTPYFSMSEYSPWTLRFKIFNFNMLSDLSATYYELLSVPQMIGNESIWFNISLPTLSAKFWSGNRIYGEAAWDKGQQPNGAVQIVLDRRFLDSLEYKGKGTDYSTNDTVTIVIVTLVAAAVVAIIIAYQIIKRRRKDIISGATPVKQ